MSQVTKPTITYFDGPVSRGEECRLALHVAGVDFIDNRLSRDQWMALKPNTPFGSVPVFELPGKPPLGQSNAILTLIGRMHGLHPKDEFEAARHLAMMEHVEDLRHRITPSMRMSDDAEKKKAREALVESYFPLWSSKAEAQIADDGPFFAGGALHVVDFKILLIVRWLRGGALDHIPGTVFAAYPKLNRVHDAVNEHPRVKDWYAKK